MAHKIVIDCGHGTSADGSWDCGCAYKGMTEAALMLPITKAAVKYCRNSGITVLSDSDNGNNLNVIKGVQRANKEKAEIFISIHCDYSGAPTGVYPLAYPGSANGKKLATCLNDSIKSGMGMKSRGIGYRSDLAELYNTDMPAVILETGGIAKDYAIFQKKYDEYGKCIAKAICKYFGIAFKDGSAPAPQPAPTPAPQPVKVATVSNRQKYINALEDYGKVIEKSFKYSNKNSKTTWASAKKNHIVNCARYASWGLQAAGVLAKGEVIYWNGSLKGSGSGRIKNSTKIKRYKPNKTVKSLAKAGKLKAGDVCMFTNGKHTMTIRSVNKSTGVVKWYTAGPSDVKAHNVRNRRRSAYDSRKISYLIRIK